MNKTFLILKKELRELFRDKKSLAMMLIIPIFIPLIIIGMSALFESQTDVDVSTYNKIGFNYELSPEEITILKSLDIDYQIADTNDLETSFADQEINSYITKDGNNYIINYDEANVESSYAAELAKNYLESYKSVLESKTCLSSKLLSSITVNVVS